MTDTVTTILFIVDYALRLMTADYKLNKTGAKAFLEYPFHPMAIIDLVSICRSSSHSSPRSNC